MSSLWKSCPRDGGKRHSKFTRSTFPFEWLVILGLIYQCPISVLELYDWTFGGKGYDRETSVCPSQRWSLHSGMVYQGTITLNLLRFELNGVSINFLIESDPCEIRIYSRIRNAYGCMYVYQEVLLSNNIFIGDHRLKSVAFSEFCIESLVTEGMDCCQFLNF
jgi:hypothetical protein